MIPPNAIVAATTPTEVTGVIDGVEVRFWLGMTEAGTAFRLAVHRVFCDPEHEAGLVRDFPVLTKRETPKDFKLGGPPC